MTAVSVIFPTRGRPDVLRETVTGLLDLAGDRAQVEVLVAVDPDDETGPPFDLPAGVLVYVASERYGYARLHTYYNHLAAMARGEWLLMWNDDAVMETPGWDEIITAQDAPAVLWPYCPQAAGANVFPAWPAAWARHLGHVSKHHSVDWWVQETGELLGRARHIPVTVRHLCVTDQTAHERSFAGLYHGPALSAARRQDAASLRKLLKDAPPANARLVSVIVAGPLVLAADLRNLLDLATDSANVEFLVAGESLREPLERAGVMGYGEVHNVTGQPSTAAVHACLERWAHGKWQVVLEDILPVPGWDELARQ